MPNTKTRGLANAEAPPIRRIKFTRTGLNIYYRRPVRRSFIEIIAEIIAEACRPRLAGAR